MSVKGRPSSLLFASSSLVMKMLSGCGAVFCSSLDRSSAAWLPPAADRIGDRIWGAVDEVTVRYTLHLLGSCHQKTTRCVHNSLAPFVTAVTRLLLGRLPLALSVAALRPSAAICCLVFSMRRTHSRRMVMRACNMQ